MIDAPNRATSEWRNYWTLPFAAGLGYATALIYVYSIGSFIAPLQAEFGWTRAQISSGMTIAASISAVFCIPMGLLIDRIGPRRIALIGALLVSAGFSLISTATGTMTNWVVLWVVIAFATLSVQATVWTSAVASRFEKSRGLALAIALSGGSLAAIVFPVLAAWLTKAYDWRTAIAAMSGLWIAFVFPVLFVFFRGAQDDVRRGSTSASERARVLTGVSFSQGLRSPALYKLLLAGGLYAFTVMGCVVHFVPILTDTGAEQLTAAGIASLIGFASIVGRLATGLLLDRFPGHIVGAAGCLLPIVASALLVADGTDTSSQTIAAIALGLTLGSEMDVVAYLASRHFGLKNFGALYGALVMALALGTAFGPFAAGAVFDRFGSYAAFLMLAAALMVVSAISLLSLGPAPRAEQ